MDVENIPRSQVWRGVPIPSWEIGILVPEIMLDGLTSSIRLPEFIWYVMLITRWTQLNDEEKNKEDVTISEEINEHPIKSLNWDFRYLRIAHCAPISLLAIGFPPSRHSYLVSHSCPQPKTTSDWPVDHKNSQTTIWPNNALVVNRHRSRSSFKSSLLCHTAFDNWAKASTSIIFYDEQISH